MAAMSVIGIDFGNESCYVAVARAGGIETIANDYSMRATPSCVAFSDQNRILGVAAKNQTVTNMKNTIYGFKRLLGRKYNDPHIQNELKHLTYQVVQQHDNNIGIKVRYLGEDKIFTPEQITAMLFTKLKDISEQALKTKVNDCVISVPSHFTNAERKALLESAQIAGLNVLRLLNEPTATALAYGIYKQDLPNPEEKPRNVIFVDCGHSTLQVAACAFNKGKLKMLASSCDPYLGGRDIDAILGEYFNLDFKKRYSIDPKSNPRAYLRLLTEVEKLKKQMSANSTKLPLNIECFMNDIDVHGDMKRSLMEEMCSDIFKRVEKTLKQCLDDSKLNVDDICSVEIVGGGSRVPAIKQLIERIFCKPASTTLNQDEAVARGCALQCALLSPAVRVREFNVTDLQNYSVKLVWDPSAGDNGEMEVFPRFHAMPFSKMLTFYRREPFSMKAYYNCPIPYPEKFIGEYTVKDVKPTPEGESTKVKVKVRVNLNGLVGVVGASMNEKREGGEEEETQQNSASVGNMGDGNKGSESSDKMDTDSQQSHTNSQENGEIDVGDKNDDDKKEVKKKKSGFKTVDLPIEERSCGFSMSQLNDYIEAECKMIAADRQEKERADARNALEEYVYDLRSKLMDDLEPFVLPTDKDTFVNNLDAMENWLYDDGQDCNRQTYADKLASLKKIGEPIKRRKIEYETRTVALEELSHCLQLSSKVVDLYKKGDEKYSHIPAEEVTKVEDAIHNAAKWLEEKRSILQNTPKTVDAPITTEQIRQERKTLESTITSTMNKPKPAPPQPSADSTKQDSSKSSDSTQPSSDSKDATQENMEVE